MKTHTPYRLNTALFITLFTLFWLINNAQAAEYRALQNVQQVRVVFDVSVGSPQGANNVFWAVRNLYQDEKVAALSQKTEVTVVFRGPAVKLVSTDLTRWDEKDSKLVSTFQETVKKMKSEGVVFEICQYAMKKGRVDSESVLAEVDQVPNGFVSIAGYQIQGYSLITIQ